MFVCTVLIFIDFIKRMNYFINLLFCLGDRVKEYVDIIKKDFTFAASILSGNFIQSFSLIVQSVLC